MKKNKLPFALSILVGLFFFVMDYSVVIERENDKNLVLLGLGGIAIALLIQLAVAILSFFYFIFVIDRIKKQMPIENSFRWYFAITPLALLALAAVFSFSLFRHSLICSNEPFPFTRGHALCSKDRISAIATTSTTFF